ncbi:Protein CBG25329 [Caenorhabditis briggsae]|uniref:Protein CBG25329 n=1 Tax=Caenorhabditis briggsae TaxID=6238 RepID=B6IH27_CAEBR|nr:Protein CBG25329 [Caenorhabditis briggsae]CAR99207.1 Protein CBG25329 [Caenorhabditis briggsae]
MAAGTGFYVKAVKSRGRPYVTSWKPEIQKTQIKPFFQKPRSLFTLFFFYSYLYLSVCFKTIRFAKNDHKEKPKTSPWNSRKASSEEKPLNQSKDSYQ